MVSNNKNPKKKQEDIYSKLLEREVEKTQEGRGEKLAGTFNMKEIQQSKMISIPVSDIYEPPFNKEWNSFQKLNADKEYELIQSIVDGGLLVPIIVWEIDKKQISDLYTEDCKYGFLGDKYMVVAGNNRTNAYIKLYHETKDEKYLNIDAIVRKNLTYDEAKYIIRVTNYVQRELNVMERRENMIFMHRTLNNNKTKGMNVANKIAEDIGCSPRTVKYQLAISDKLVDGFIAKYDNGEITMVNAVKLANLTKPMQKWMLDTFGEKVTDKVLKNLRKSYDKKEQIVSLFDENKVIEYTTISVEIPKEKEKTFKKMLANWLSKNK